MDSSAIVFRKYSTRSEADVVLSLLLANGIKSSLADATYELEGTIAGTDVHPKFELRLEEKDFEAADNILEQACEARIEDLDEEYYLLHYSNEELLNVIIHSFEWSEHDVALSKKILQFRNVHIDELYLKEQRELELAELAKPESGQPGWIMVGYVSAILGGFFGLLIGYFLWKPKKNLPNGKQVFVYDEIVRAHGKRIFIFSCITFPVLFIIKFFDEIEKYMH